MGGNPESLKDFFHIALQIVSSLEGLYQNRVIHKDIKPANILIHPSTLEVKLIDFSDYESTKLQDMIFLES